MVIIEVVCKYCHSGEAVRKHGFGRAGFPRYFCKKCLKSFQINYKYNGHKKGTKDKILNLAMSGISIRDTVQILGVGTNTVIRALNMK